MYLLTSTTALLVLLTSTSALQHIDPNDVQSPRSTRFAVVTAVDESPSYANTNGRTFQTQPPSAELSEDEIEGEAEELKRRQVTGQGAAVALPTAAAADQVSPVTTYDILQWKPGAPAPVQIEVIFTQLFASPLDQWPSATAGAIGMGTIQGEIGVVKSKDKRDVEGPLQTFAARAFPKSGGESGDGDGGEDGDGEEGGEAGEPKDPNSAARLEGVGFWRVTVSVLSALIILGGLEMF